MYISYNFLGVFYYSSFHLYILQVHGILHWDVFFCNHPGTYRIQICDIDTPNPPFQFVFWNISQLWVELLWLRRRYNFHQDFRGCKYLFNKGIFLLRALFLNISYFNGSKNQSLEPLHLNIYIFLDYLKSSMQFTLWGLARYCVHTTATLDQFWNII